mgnify:CR=1 FL=1|tara:strand:- start:5117 stop:7216 length:2100 start_codon:yes stop_codon:yes gene_type:complete
MTFETELRFVKGVGPRRFLEFRRAGLGSLEDLLLRLPLRYEDRSHLSNINDLKVGDVSIVKGKVLSAGLRSTRKKGFSIFEVAVSDCTGTIRAIFFNQKFLIDILRPHRLVVLHGKVEVDSRRGVVQFKNPHYEILSENEAKTKNGGINTGRIIPIYERIGSLSSRILRRIVHEGLRLIPEVLEDPLSLAVREKYRFPGRLEAIHQVHFPDDGTKIEDLNECRSPAQRRLIFEEFYLFQRGLAIKRAVEKRTRKNHSIRVNQSIRQSALNVLPFRLTDGQKKALREIVDDLRNPYPMNRLLQGDVGSGKTILAVLAGLVAMENGLQVAVMSPTELLAHQHYINILGLLKGSAFKSGILTGSLNNKDRMKLLDSLQKGDCHLVVGTQALIQEMVNFKRLGLIIIDEQHRFGVLQRASLRDKSKHPDVLVMTATPIPRTLAMTVYGDLDVSVIEDLPPGRIPIETRVTPTSTSDKAYLFIRDQIRLGHQAYVVYPLVEESEKLGLRSAETMFEELCGGVFDGLRVGLLHGRIRVSEREAVMRRFVEGEIDVLIATTVIEVGVDVPNATVMMVENAQRFGLAQLHQLRGRVGRGIKKSYCLLVHDEPVSENGRMRLKALENSSDGFEIAEHDLDIRGEGDLIGTRQSGLPPFRTGNLLRDRILMEEARREASEWVMRRPQGISDDDEIMTSWSERFRLVEVG